MLLNLIRNAFEALDGTGTICITAERDNDMTRFSVVDNGPGVPPGQEEALFEPFVSSKTGGMGIGLAICRTIVEAHGGKMWCEPAPAAGAAFRFTIPSVEGSDDR